MKARITRDDVAGAPRFLARITRIHKISPRPAKDTEVVKCLPDDLHDLASVRKLLLRCGYSAPNTKNDRRDTLGRDENLGGRYILFPRTGPWHSIIVREEPQ